MFYISGLRLEKPSLDLNLNKTSPGLSSINSVAALPGGAAVVRHYISDNLTEQILKINSQGKVIQTIYTCVGCSSIIQSLLVLADYLYLTHTNGTVIKTRVSNGLILRRSTIPDVGWVINAGSLYSKPDKIPDKQTLLLCDYRKGDVFTFTPSTGQKQVRVTGLNTPRSVSYLFYNHTVFYIVCEGGRHRINVYDNIWKHIRTISSIVSNSGEYINPQAAIVSDEDTIIIADYHYRRVSEFSFNGTFLRHLLDRSDGINGPYSLSYYYPHLWLVDGYPHGELYRYNLYR